jgi:UDP-galactopyranose mutase
MHVIAIGSGLSGSTAFGLLSSGVHDVEIFEQRGHIGGNCYDSHLEVGRWHKFGPHLFHTNDDDVWNFLSRFTEWTGYEHRVVADTVRGRICIPYSQTTERQLQGWLSDEAIRYLIFRDYS